MWGGLCIASIFLTHMVRGVSKVNGWFGLPPRQLLVLGIMSTGMITLILCIIAVLIALPIYGSPVTAMYASVLHKLPLVWQLFCQFVVLGATQAVWVVIYFSIMLQRRRHRAELRQAQLSEALQEAELQLLKFQLNPHFLFNALNGVRALIADEPAQSAGRRHPARAYAALHARGRRCGARHVRARDGNGERLSRAGILAPGGSPRCRARDRTRRARTCACPRC